MEQFIVSARKYRPTQFSEVVGQRSITETLENAIANNHLAQALLFTGPRGVGKTTCARILAKRINQTEEHQVDEDFAFNIFELDAASNNSVDDIRELIEQVRIPPQVGKYKVYIIDEVHMLSTAAFNAFLKTLEEPPKHAIFILATTEKHKIIPTILSRCQIFDFKRITVNDIKEHLHTICEKEGITAEDDALHIIAQKADGALRDALSAFDRVVSFSGKNLTREAVAENLNVLDYTYYFNITHLALTNDVPNLFLAYDSILNKGYDGHQFIRGLGSHFRDLLVAQNESTIPLLEVGDNVKQMYFKQSKMLSAQMLREAIKLTNKTDLDYKNSQNQRLLVELCLLELASLNAGEEKKTIERVVLAPTEVTKTEASTQTQAPAQATSTAQTQVEAVQTQPKPETETPSSSQVPSAAQSVVQEPIEEKQVEASAPKAEVKAPPVKDAPKQRVSALSLSSIQKAQEIKEQFVEEDKGEEINTAEDAFTQEEFEAAWKSYSAIVSERKQHILHSHLQMLMPKVKGNIAYVTYPNNSIKIEVERESYSILEHIRAKLNNYKVELEISVDETQAEVKQYVYTDKDIYEKMYEINPEIKNLIQKFNLEI